jgi:hypothetical protein
MDGWHGWMVYMIEGRPFSTMQTIQPWLTIQPLGTPSLNPYFCKKTSMSAETRADRKEKPGVPDHLIYEWDEGKPIYYSGYQAVLNQKKTPEDIMGSSALQSLIISLLSDFLKDKLGPEYIRLSNELGLLLPKKTRRSLDLAVYNKSRLADISFLLEAKYPSVAPELVFEMDTKADLLSLDNPQHYFHRKTDQLLSGGVEKVIWIFTEPRKFLFAQAGRTWIVGNWSDDMEIMPGIVLNLDRLIKTVLD